MTKQCIKCKEVKEITAFGKCSANKSGISNWCKPCRVESTKQSRLSHPRKVYKDRKAESKRYRQKYPDKVKASLLKSRYGITVENYNQMLVSQDGVCSICKGINSNGKPLFIDHNHETGKVRELLCTTCNSAIGLLKENPFLALEVARYLERHSLIV